MRKRLRKNGKRSLGIALTLAVSVSGLPINSVYAGSPADRSDTSVLYFVRFMCRPVPSYSTLLNELFSCFYEYNYFCSYYTQKNGIIKKKPSPVLLPLFQFGL